MGFRRFAFLATMAAAVPAQAQEVCAQPSLRLIVTFPAGGAADAMARILAPVLGQAMSRNVIVENRAGAAGMIGAQEVARSPADGCTVLVAFDTQVVTPLLVPRQPFDAVRDFAPVSMLGTAPLLLVAGPGTPFRSFADVVTAARARPNELAFGSVGQGSLGHLAMALLQGRGGYQLTHVPYRGTAPMTADALGGSLPLAVASVPALRAQTGEGRLRPLMVTGAARSNGLADTPTAMELGLAEAPMVSWWGMMVRAGTPVPMMNRLQRETVAAVETPAIRARLSEQGLDPRTSTPAEFGAFLDGERRRWAEVIRANDIRPE